MLSDELRQPLRLSPFIEALDRRHPGWLPALADEGRLTEDRPPSADTLDAAIGRHGLDAGLRRFRNREMLRITWREITAAASLEETLADLTRLAELCLEAALAHHETALRERFGSPRDADGEPQSLVVIGLGKLGGGELNLSSDIDIVLVYPSAGVCDGRRGLANEQFFTRLARAVVGSLAERTEDGFCFRVDTRLRPFGDAGPLVCSFGAMEQYYQREGRDWERYALVKARPVAGDRAAGQALLDSLKPFVYRRYIDFGAVEALQTMLASIQADAARRGREGDVKRGPGGIREVEFLVQCVQLLRGGREPSLRTPSLYAALDALATLGLFPRERVDGLRSDYAFLRRLENAIQAQHDQQTHVLPDGEDLRRIVEIMEQPDEPALLNALAETRERVSAALEASFPRREDDPGETGPWQERLDDGAHDEWAGFLERVARLVLTDQARQRLDQFMPLLLERTAANPPSPDVLRDVQNLVLTIVRRSAYLALLVQNPRALDRMRHLFTASDWVAETVIRYPALLDEMIDPSLGRDLPNREELVRSAQRLTGGSGDEEHAINALNHFKRAQQLRIAVAELEGALSSEEAEQRLTELAEVLVGRCLSLATEVISRRHGALPGGGLAVIGYGSLGAGDISYGSDLDLVFLYPDGQGESDGQRPLAAETWYTRMVRRLLAIATTLSPAGRLYDIDTRLRPNGRAGLLVSPVGAFDRYQHESAWVWEWQALTRARPVAGDPEVGRQFEAVRASVLEQHREADTLRREIPAMRERLRAQVTGDRFKHGRGGLLDIDFTAQLGVLECGDSAPPLREPRSTRDQLRLLGDLGWLDPADARVLIDTHAALVRARHLDALCREGAGPEPDVGPARRICARLGIGLPAAASDSR